MNLLPLEDQLKIRNERLLRLFEMVGAGAFFILLVAVIILSSAYFFLALQSGELRRQLAIGEQSSELRRAQSLDQAIKDLNTRSRSLGDNEKQIRDPLVEVAALLSVKPYGIGISSIGYDRAGKTNSTIIVSGQANTRNNLLKYVGALEASAVFARVNSPVSNLLSREKLSFTLVLDLK
jgi:hypothetical protein